jgi:predicted heme/steroid binding protein
VSEEQRIFTRDELRRCNGLEGAPALIAFEGQVYDVGSSFLWQRGNHQGVHRPGDDLTEALADAPHGADLLARVPVVGRLAER